MHTITFILQNLIFYKMVENCWGGSGYSAETPGRLGFKGLSNHLKHKHAEEHKVMHLKCSASPL